MRGNDGGCVAEHGHRAGLARDQHQDCWAWWACSQEMRSERNGPLHPPIITKATMSYPYLLGLLAREGRLPPTERLGTDTLVRNTENNLNLCSPVLNHADGLANIPIPTWQLGYVPRNCLPTDLAAGPRCCTQVGIIGSPPTPLSTQITNVTDPKGQPSGNHDPLTGPVITSPDCV